MSPSACEACGATIRRRTGLLLCGACTAIAERIFSDAHQGADPDTWMRERARFFGGTCPPCIAAVVAWREGLAA